MAVVLPFDASNPFYEFTTTIGGVSYRFNVRWNGRDAAWYFDVFEIDDTPIASGIKIVLGCYLGRFTQHTLFRDGVFVAVDLGADANGGVARDATIDDLGTRVQVMRLDISDVLSLRITATYPDA